MKYLYLFLLCLINTHLFAQVVFKNYDISPGADSSTPGIYTNCNGKMYFIAKTQVHGYELWAIDSSGNTQMLTNNITKQYDAPQILGELNGKLVFTAFDTTHGDELWITDGTPANTKLLKDIYPGKESGINNGTFGCLLNGKIYFSAATAANGNELWATDGTDTGTHLISDIHPGPGNANPTDYNTINGKIFFWANDGTHYHEPWISDGTQAGTMLLKDINPTGGGFYYNATVVSNGLLFFWAHSSYSSSDVAVWVTDGTTAGTIVLENRANHGGGYISKFVAYKNKVYYWNHSDTGLAGQLWVTDGTNAGTRVFSNAAPNTYMHCSRDFLVFKDKLYFTGGLYRTDTMSGCELWVTDGTDAGTKLVADLGGKYGSTPSYLASLGDYIYFLAQDSDHIKLYRTDGTAAGTQTIAPYNATSQKAFDWGYDHTLHLYNNKLWTKANFTNTGMELWSIEDMFPQSIHKTTNNSAAMIILYPNPAHHNFTIKTTTTFTKGSVTLTDVTGKVVMDKYPITNSQSQIPLHNIAPGIYIADVWLDDKRSTQRLTIQ